MKNHNRRSSQKLKSLVLCFGLALVAASGSATTLFAQTTTAIPDAFNEWSDSSTWDTGVVPDSSSAIVVIDGDASTDSFIRIRDTEEYVIKSLQIDAGDQVHITSDANFFTPSTLKIESRFGDDLSGILINNSKLSIYSSSAEDSPRSTLFLEGNSVISGNGSIGMVRGRLRLDSDYRNKIVNESNVIQGSGDLDLGERSTVENGVEGEVRATGGELNINISDFLSEFNNFGTLTASNDGALHINGGTLNNHGVIAPAFDSKVVFKDTRLIGGQLSSPGAGRIEIGSTLEFPTNFDPSIFQDVSIAGAVHITPLSQLNLRGTIENNSSIVIESGTVNTGDIFSGQATVAAGTSLIGDGEVVLAGGLLRFLSNETAPSVVTRLENVVRGNGIVEVLGNLTNEQGNQLIAERGTLGIGPVSGSSRRPSGIINRSQLIANDSGVLGLYTDSVDNTDGVILANDGGVVRSATDITGGQLKTLGSGIIELGSGRVANATLDGNFLVRFNNQFELTGDIENLGTINVDGSTFNTQGSSGLRISGETVLQGGGVVELATSRSGILGNLRSAPGILRNVDNTIRGIGKIGYSNLQVINEAGGLIEARAGDSDGYLSISDLKTPLLNGGTIRAAAGSTLSFANDNQFSIANTSVNNDGGFIEALGTGSRVIISDTSIDGGSLSTDSLGTFYIPKGDLIFELQTNISNVSLSGNFQFEREGDLGLAGEITNTSQIQVSTPRSTSGFFDPYFAPRIVAKQDVSLSGGGELHIDGDLLVISDLVEGNRPQLGAGGDFTNIDGTISGNAVIDFYDHQFINDIGGVIAANRAGDRLQINASGLNSQFVNRGVLRASNGGELGISSGPNAPSTPLKNDGSIEALDGSELVLFQGSSIDGGSIRGEGSGKMMVSSQYGSHSSDVSILKDVNLDIDIELSRRTHLQLVGEIVNQQVITASDGSQLQIGGATTLSGGGTIQLGDPTLSNANADTVSLKPTSAVFASVQLQNIDNTIQGFGEIDGLGVAIVNEIDGTIDANVNDRQLAVSIRPNTPFTNRGTLRASNGGRLELRGADFSNDGVIATDTLSTVFGSGQLTNAAGGTLQGNGTLEFETIFNAGTIAPGESPGTLNILGDLLMEGTSTLEIEAGGTAPGMYDLLFVDGNAVLGGTLSLDLTGFTGDSTDEIVFLSANQVSGSFDNVVFGDSLRSSDGRFDFVVLHDSSVANSSRLLLTNISIASVPEPSSFGLLGLAALFSLSRRRLAL